MNKSVKNYTNSDLFKLANEIRKSTGCSKSEAYHRAKAELENPKKKASQKIRITDKMKKHTLGKRNLHVGDTFASVKELATFTGLTVQNLYGYIRIGVIEKVND